MTTISAEDATFRTCLRAGETLSTGEYLYSPNKRFRFSVQNNDSVLLDGDRTCWSAYPRGWPSSNQVILRHDGHLVLCEDGREHWSTERDGMRNIYDREEYEKIRQIYQRLKYEGERARYDRRRRMYEDDPDEQSHGEEKKSTNSDLLFSLHDDGNANLTYQGTVLWSSDTTQRLSPRFSDSDKRSYLYVGETLYKDQSLLSQNGNFEVFMGDGILALRYKGGKTLWEQGPGWPSDKAKLTSNGELLVFDDRGGDKWSSGAAGKGDRDTYLEIKDDGNMVIVSNEITIWTSNTTQTPAQIEENQAKPINPAKSGTDCLLTSESLEKDQYLQSPNGKIRLVMQGDGNLVVYLINDGETSPLWASGTTDRIHPPVRAVLQVDGNLKLFSDDGKERWSSGSSGMGTSLKIQDDGNVVMYSEGKKIWATNTRDGSKDPKPDPVKPGEKKNSIQKAADTAPDRLEASQYLVRNQPLISPNGKNRLVLQDDGNLVLYKTFNGNPMAIWNSNTSSYDQPLKASLEEDGNFRLLSDRSNERWTSRSHGGNAVLIVQDDCNAVILSGPVTIWSTNTKEKPVTDTLKAGESRGVNEPLVSANGKHSLILQGDGNCVFYSDGKATWASNTNNIGSAKSLFKLTEEGALAVQDWSGGVDHLSKYHSKPTLSTTLLRVRDDGNLVILDGAGQVIWSPNTSLMPPESSFYTAVNLPCDRLTTGQYISVNQQLSSPNGAFSFAVSSDCTVSVKHNSGLVVWSQKVDVVPSRLVMQFDGNMVLESSEGKPLWATGTRGDSNSLILHDDGNAVVDAHWQGWETGNHYPATKGTIDRLSRKDVLLLGQILTSPNGRYELDFAENLIMSIRDKQTDQTKYWSLADKSGLSGAKFLTLVDPGYLEIHDASNRTIWTNKIGTKPMKKDNESWISPAKIVDFVLQDDGNAVVLRDGQAKWAANDWPSSNSPQFQVRDRLSKNGVLRIGESLTPANGMVTLTMQGDGNLILYHKMFGAIWGSNTWSHTPDIDKLILQQDGNLVVLGKNGNARWTSGTSGRWGESVELVVQGDGRAVLYSNGQQIWDTGIPRDMFNRPRW